MLLLDKLYSLYIENKNVSFEEFDQFVQAANLSNNLYHIDLNDSNFEPTALVYVYDKDTSSTEISSMKKMIKKIAPDNTVIFTPSNSMLTSMTKAELTEFKKAFDERYELILAGKDE